MNQTIYARKNLYHLKRRFGVAVDLYHFDSTTLSFPTGRVEVKRSKYHIRKVVIFPISLTRELNVVGMIFRVSPTLQNNENDLQSSIAIVDRRDLPTGFEINPNDYILIKNRDRYAIQKGQITENEFGYLLNIRFLKGAARNAIFDSMAFDLLDLVELNQVGIN